MAENPKIKELLRKLAAITVEAGATEAEAMAAAMKARQLADREGIDLASVGEPDITETIVGTGRVRYRPIDVLWGAVARFCHCDLVFLIGGELEVSYIGQPHDVALAEWLHVMLKRHIDRALAAFKETPQYRRRKPHRRRLAAASFVEGMVSSLCFKLWSATDPQIAGPKLDRAKAFKDAQHQCRGTASIPAVKGSRLGDARLAGRRAGQDVEINTPVTGSAAPAGLLAAK